jgi:hypothetical protein
MRMLVTAEGASGFAGNVNYIDLTAASSTSTTSLTAPVSASLAPDGAEDSDSAADVLDLSRKA